MSEPPHIEPETTDWTVVITAGCAECGFDPDVPVTDIGSRLRTTIPQWSAVLARPDAAVRPQPTVWSPLEYACHVRDVCRIFGERLELMRTEDDPLFANWDQDETAVRERYFTQEPAMVAEQYADEAEATAAAFDAVRAGGVRATGPAQQRLDLHRRDARCVLPARHRAPRPRRG